MEKIKFGTDGWRGVIARDYTIESVAKVAYATALWLIRKYKSPSAVVGYDCRFGGEMFMEAVAKILASKSIRVYISEQYVSTPMVSLGVRMLKANCGIMISACNGPVNYNGYKLKGDHGGPMFEKDIKDIENLISNENEIDLELLNWNYMLEQGLIQYINLENIYIKQIRDNFSLDDFRASGLKFAFDAMYGSGQNIMKKILPETVTLHCEVNPGFNGIPPDPVRKNLHELAELIIHSKDIDYGLAVDGDADCIALFDAEGNLIDANAILLILVHYLAGYKQTNGKIVAGFSSTEKVQKICDRYELPLILSRIGFKEIAKIMSEENVLIAGEESGGIALGDHLPERDGIWAGLMVAKAMVETGKSLRQLLDEVYAITGPFAYERIDLELNRNVRTKVIENCRNNVYKNFGPFKIKKTVILDGYKYYFNENQWLLVRASGTEPVIRLYAESETPEETQSIIMAARDTLVNGS
jgi:phosphomannomutase